MGSIKGDSKPRGERAARDESGKYTRVPADMSYHDWKVIYIDKKITLSDWKASKSISRLVEVKDEYTQNAALVKPDVIYPRGYSESKHRQEIKVAEIICNLLGGRIELLRENRGGLYN